MKCLSSIVKPIAATATRQNSQLAFSQLLCLKFSLKFINFCRNCYKQTKEETADARDNWWLRRLWWI